MKPTRAMPEIGDTVYDQTALNNNWPDCEGVILEIDGSNIKVRYLSGNERWKLSINLRLKEVGGNHESS